MTIIKESEVTLERIQKLFHKKNISTNVIVNVPAESACGLRCDAYLELKSENNNKIIIWINSTGDPEKILRMRSILLGQKESKLIDPGKLNTWITKINQKGDYLGTIDGESALGVTLEYKTPFNGGILEQAIFSAYDDFLKSEHLGKNILILGKFMSKYGHANN
ncbi:MAG: hypothetical protein ISR69_06360 [Gammaproteobacteria bacterium]|nr:hypothetical protein [Gammaproteobacteria bacterium]